MKKITKKEMKAYMKRWELVNNREREELRRMTPEERLSIVSGLMLSAKKLGWDKKLEKETKAVRERWVRLKEIYRSRNA